MGFLGFGKKNNEKAKKQQMADKFKDGGMGSFGGKTKGELKTETMNRTENVSRFNQISEKLKAIRTQLYSIDGFDDLADRCEELLRKLKLSVSNNDNDATYAVDGFILKVITNLEQFVISEDYLGIESFLTNLNTYIVDRKNAPSYYKNEKYVDLKIVEDKKNVMLQNIQSEYDRLHAQASKYLAELNNPNSKLNRKALEGKFISAKEDLKRLQKQIDEINADLAAIKDSLATFKQHDIKHADDDIADITQSMEDAIEISAENNYDRQTREKLHGKLKDSRNKVTTGDISVDASMVDDVTSSTSSQKNFTLDDL